MLIVRITREEPKPDGGYQSGREIFRYEADDLDVQAIVRAALEADRGAAAARMRMDRLERAANEIEGFQYCLEGCERTAANVVRAARRGEPLPTCGGHEAPPEV